MSGPGVMNKTKHASEYVINTLDSGRKVIERPQGSALGSGSWNFFNMPEIAAGRH
jgi:hypothetical protein